MLPYYTLLLGWHNGEQTIGAKYHDRAACLRSAPISRSIGFRVVCLLKVQPHWPLSLRRPGDTAASSDPCVFVQFEGDGSGYHVPVVGLDITRDH